jgi:hypothetical protein
MELGDFETEQEKAAFIAGRMADKRAEFNAVISLGQTALKIPLLINGGAAIAILALVGNTWKEKSLTADLAWSLLFFSIGVFMIALGSGASYISQGNFSEEKGGGWRWRLTAIILVVISYILFMFGSCWAFHAFYTLKLA